jgi:hypothetical protein
MGKPSVFIANIGQRDVVVDVAEPSAAPSWHGFDAKGAGFVYDWLLRHHPRSIEGVARDRAASRDLGAAVRTLRSALGGRIRTPILDPALELAKRRNGNKRLDAVVIIGTSQPGGSFAHTDTFETAQLVAELLRERGERAEAVVYEGDPSQYDLARAGLRDLFDSALPKPWALERVFSSLRGGTPQMNAALMDHALTVYGHRANLIATTEPRDPSADGVAREVDSWVFRRDGIERVLRALLEQHDYHGARRLLDAERVTDAAVLALLDYSNARMNLDTDAAREAASRYTIAVGGTLPSAFVLSDDPWGPEALRVVANTALALLQRGDFIGVATRIASFCEHARRQLVAVTLGLRIEGKLDREAIGDPAIERGLDDRIPGRVGAGFWYASNSLYNALIDLAAERPSSSAHARAARLAIEGLTGVEGLRHQAVHQALGYSASELAGALGCGRDTIGQRLGQRTEAVVAAIHPGAEKGAGLFRVLNELALERWQGLRTPRG